MSNQRRLGRGLEALLGRSLDTPSGPTTANLAPAVEGQADADVNAASPSPAADTPPAVDESSADGEGLMTRDPEGQRWLDLGVIEPNPFQPRREFEEEAIADLADSIREHGVLQPLAVRRVEGRFELIAGERRLRAAQAAGWQRVPVQLKDVDDRQTAELAIVENLQRKDLNAIEKAASFERYLAEYGCTQDELARRVQVDRSTVANLVRLLELPESVKRQIVRGELTQGHGRALLGLPEHERESAAARVTKDGLSVRKTERLVQDLTAEKDGDALRVVGADGVSRQAGTRSEQIAALETELRNAIGAKVELKQNAKGAGRITLHFADADEFERLRGLLLSSGGPTAQTGT